MQQENMGEKPPRHVRYFTIQYLPLEFIRVYRTVMLSNFRSIGIQSPKNGRRSAIQDINPNGVITLHFEWPLAFREF